MNARRGAMARPLPSFGRRLLASDSRQRERATDFRDDLRLFALTFAGGFLFMSVYLA